MAQTRNDFKSFLLRGNVVDLAIGVVIGVAFGNVVSAFVRDLLTPLIALIGGQRDISDLSFTISHTRFSYGDFLNTLLSFVIISAVVYFLLVLPMTRLLARVQRPPEVTTHRCSECLSEIPMAARRCAHCTSQQVALPGN